MVVCIAEARDKKIQDKNEANERGSTIFIMRDFCSYCSFDERTLTERTLMARNQIKDFTIFSVELGWAGVECIFTLAIFKLKVFAMVLRAFSYGPWDNGPMWLYLFCAPLLHFFFCIGPSNHQGSRCTWKNGCNRIASACHFSRKFI